MRNGSANNGQSSAKAVVNSHDMKLATIRGHTFLVDPLGANAVVVDLGAHKGEFSRELNRRYGCQCHMVEALPDLHAQLIEANGLRKCHGAMTGTDGPVTLFVSENPEANSIINGMADNKAITVDGMTLDTFMAKAGLNKVDLLKVDIEGAEIGLLESASERALAGISQISVEFHDFFPGCVDPARVEGVKSRLRRIGFLDLVFSHRVNTDVLFINSSQLDISRLELLHLKYVTKYLRGLARMIRRRWGGGRMTAG